MTTTKLDRLLSYKSSMGHMRKAELALALKDTLEFLEMLSSPTKVPIKPTTEADAIAQLGKLFWRDAKGNNIQLNHMDEQELRCRVSYINKRVAKLSEFESGTTWVGLTVRQWQKVFFYIMEQTMPAAEVGFYNHLQEQFLAAEKASRPVRVDKTELYNSIIRDYEGDAVGLYGPCEEDDTAWYDTPKEYGYYNRASRSY